MAVFLSGPINDQSWLDDAKEAFSEASADESSNKTPSLKTKFELLYQNYKENIKSWWEELISDILKSKTESDFKTRELSLKSSVDRYCTTLKERKHKRFVRDLADFRDRQAYSFLNKTTTLVTPRPRTERRQIQILGPLSLEATKIKKEDGGVRGTGGEEEVPDIRIAEQGQPLQPEERDGYKIKRNASIVNRAFEMQIVNLSRHRLSSNEEKILRSGLSFVPTTRFDAFNWVKDVHLFVRKLKWRKHFCLVNRKRSQELGISVDMLEDVDTLIELENEGTREIGKGPFSTLKNKSKKTPPLGDYTTLDLFCKIVSDEIKMIHPRKHATISNVAEDDRDAITNLEQNNNIVIKPSDKGGNIVLLDRETYVQMCAQLLRDQRAYERLKENPTPTYSLQLKRILDIAQQDNLISTSEYEFLFPRYPKLATFYAVPKIHKGTNPIKGRPIVSGIDSLTQNCSMYIDQILRSFVTTLPSYIRDTLDLLGKIEDITLEDNMILASIDVEALYTSIPHDKGMEAVNYFLSMRGNQMEAHNRYIDDILVIWSGSTQSFKEFVEDLNINQIGLKFTYEIGGDRLGFLDIYIKKGLDGGLETTLYRKPSATNTFLQWNSHHPESLKRGIPKGQFLRIRRNCSDKHEFDRQAGQLTRRFLDRGYPNGVIHKAYKFAAGKDRHMLLNSTRREEVGGLTRLVGTFDDQNNQVMKILGKYWGILKQDLDIVDNILPYPSVTFRRGRNLKDHICKEEYYDDLDNEQKEEKSEEVIDVQIEEIRKSESTFAYTEHSPKQAQKEHKSKDGHKEKANNQHQINPVNMKVDMNKHWIKLRKEKKVTQKRRVKDLLTTYLHMLQEKANNQHQINPVNMKVDINKHWIKLRKEKKVTQKRRVKDLFTTYLHMLQEKVNNQHQINPVNMKVDMNKHWIKLRKEKKVTQKRRVKDLLTTYLHMLQEKANNQHQINPVNMKVDINKHWIKLRKEKVTQKRRVKDLLTTYLHMLQEKVNNQHQMNPVNMKVDINKHWIKLRKEKEVTQKRRVKDLLTTYLHMLQEKANKQHQINPVNMKVDINKHWIKLRKEKKEGEEGESQQPTSDKSSEHESRYEQTLDQAEEGEEGDTEEESEGSSYDLSAHASGESQQPASDKSSEHESRYQQTLDQAEEGEEGDTEEESEGSSYDLSAHASGESQQPTSDKSSEHESRYQQTLDQAEEGEEGDTEEESEGSSYDLSAHASGESQQPTSDKSSEHESRYQQTLDQAEEGEEGDTEEESEGSSYDLSAHASGESQQPTSDKSSEHESRYEQTLDQAEEGEEGDTEEESEGSFHDLSPHASGESQQPTSDKSSEHESRYQQTLDQAEEGEEGDTEEESEGSSYDLSALSSEESQQLTSDKSSESISEASFVYVSGPSSTKDSYASFQEQVFEFTFVEEVESVIQPDAEMTEEDSLAPKENLSEEAHQEHVSMDGQKKYQEEEEMEREVTSASESLPATTEYFSIYKEILYEDIKEKAMSSEFPYSSNIKFKDGNDPFFIYEYSEDADDYDSSYYKCPSNEEGSDSYSDQHHFKEKPIKEKKPIHKKSSEEKKPIHKKSSEEKKPIHKKSSEEKKPIHKKSSEEKKPIPKKSSEEKKPIHKKSSEEKHYKEDKPAKEKYSKDDSPQEKKSKDEKSSEKKEKDKITSNEKHSNEDKSPKDKISKDDPPKEDKSKDKKSSNEKKSNEDKSPKEDKSKDKKSSNEKKSNEDKSPKDDKSKDKKSSNEKKSNEDKSPKNDKSIDKKSSNEKKSNEDKSFKDDKSKDKKSSNEKKSNEDKSPKDDKSKDKKSSNEKKSNEDKSPKDDKPKDKKSSNEENSKKDDSPQEKNSKKDDSPQEKNPNPPNVKKTGKS
ncbi:uncharacterized protein ACNLHF_016669 [Anomaloglossus baeobatrachus]